MRSLAALLWGAPIGVLGGLIGLGGAEFRLPVLKATFGYEAQRAVAVNLAVSFITVIAALAIRATATPWEGIVSLWPAIVGLVVGAMAGARVGATYANRLSHERFERLILILLLAMGAMLIAHAFMPHHAAGLGLGTLGAITVGALLGAGIGVVSSLLGVAGGELLIPTFVLVFGAEMKIAGTASLIVSLPTVLVGLSRYVRAHAIQRSDLGTLIAPMGVGSIAGALLGGLLIRFVPSAALAFVLGIILMISAARIFRQPAVLRIATTTSAVDSGVLPALLEHFRAQTGCRTAVRSVGSGRAFELLRAGEADIALTHAPERERQALADLVAKSVTPFMQNRFVIVGPRDVADLATVPDAAEAMRRVARSGRPFISRNDRSGTHDRERALWERAGVVPARLVSSNAGMADTLFLASRERGFTLSDHATYAAHASELDLAVVFDVGSEIDNTYSLVLSSRATPAIQRFATALTVFVRSSEARELLLRAAVHPA